MRRMMTFGSPAKFLAYSMLRVSVTKSASRSSVRELRRHFRRAVAPRLGDAPTRSAPTPAAAGAGRRRSSRARRAATLSTTGVPSGGWRRGAPARSRPRPARACRCRGTPRTASGRARARAPAAAPRTAPRALPPAASRIRRSSAAETGRRASPSLRPSLTKVGPSSSSAMRMRCAGSSVTDSATGLRVMIWPARSSTPAMPMRCRTHGRGG